MYELAKKSREAMKSKARRLASERDMKVDSSNWTPAPLLRAEVKTGARPIMKPSAKGIGESNAAADTKAAIGDVKRGAYKSGGSVKSDAGVYDKKALGDIDPRPHRGATPTPYKKGGKVKKDIGGALKNLATSGLLGLGGKLIGDSAKRADDERDQSNIRNAQMVAAMNRKKGGRIKREDGGKLPDPYEAMRSEERQKNIRVEDKRKMPSPKEAAESAARTGDVPEGRKSGGKNWIAGAIKKPGALRKSLGVKEGENIPAKKLAKAAESPGKLGQRARLAQTLKKLGKKRGGSVGLTVVIADKGGRGMPQAPVAPIAPRAVPVPPAMGAMGSPAPMPPPPPGAPPAMMPPGRKSGGRITKVASSYKDMEAGAVTGEGRLQKTDIAKKHGNAPARKAGGRVAKSYKDMTAGAESGEGRLQKTSIAKFKKFAP